MEAGAFGAREADELEQLRSEADLARGEPEARILLAHLRQSVHDKDVIRRSSGDDSEASVGGGRAALTRRLRCASSSSSHPPESKNDACVGELPH